MTSYIIGISSKRSIILIAVACLVIGCNKNSPVEATGSPDLAKLAQEVQLTDKGSRADRIEHQTEVYRRVRHWDEGRDFLKKIATGQTQGVTPEEKFYTAMAVASMGLPTRLGPNSIGGWKLGDYIKIQQGMQPKLPDESDAERRHLKIDPKIEDLVIFIQPDEKEGGYTFQELLWLIVKNYQLEYNLIDDTLVISGKGD